MALSLLLLSRPALGGGDGAVAAPPLQIQLTVKKPLRLVRYVTDRRRPQQGPVGLEGSLEVTLRNSDPSRAASNLLILRKQEVHGFLFRPKGGGPSFIPLHSCQCVHDATAGAWQVLGVGLGKDKVLTFDDWGCSGGPWPAPAPGAYLVSYRAQVLPEPLGPPPAPSHEEPPALIAQCKERLASEAFWQGAARSNEVEVTLADPAPVHLTRRETKAGRHP